MAPRASAIKEQGFSEAVAARIEAPQRASTRSVYEAKWAIFTKWCPHQYNRICMQAKSQFLKAKIQDNHNNTQKLWRVLGDVLHRLPAKILPSIKPPQLLADRFVEFFTEKIEKIRSTFSASVNLQHITPDSPPPCSPLFVL